MLLSCVKRVRDKLGYSVGITVIGRVLRGSKDQKVLEQGLNRLSTYGILPEKSRTEIRAIAGHLEAEGYLETEPEHQTLRLTPKAAEILYQGKPVLMPMRKAPEPISVKSPVPAALTAMDADLYDVLRALRARLAKESNVPPFVIFSNATLQDMAQKKPTTVTAFKRVSGVGELKATWYAKPFLEAIKQFELTADS
jgi:ATP-dependent DNA helicase RecQ